MPCRQPGSRLLKRQQRSGKAVSDGTSIVGAMTVIKDEHGSPLILCDGCDGAAYPDNASALGWVQEDRDLCSGCLALADL